MYISLEAFQPYESSLIWTQHRDYYQQAGTAAFLKQEVPFNISSNPCLAAQTVRLLLANSPNSAQPLQILELGAGLGILALNILEALARLAPERLAQTCYWLSDFSPSGLEALAAHPAFARWVEGGQLKIVCLDGQNPQVAYDLEGQPLEWPAAGFQLILANYFFSTLPTAVLLKQGEQWLRQHSQLCWQPLGPEPASEQVQLFCQTLAATLSEYDLSSVLTSEHPHAMTLQALFQAQQQVAQKLSSLAFAELLETNTEASRQAGNLWLWLQQALIQAWQEALQQTSLTSLEVQMLEHLLLKPLLTRPSYAAAELTHKQCFVQEEASAIFTDPTHQALVESSVKDWSLASVGYSAAGLQSLNQLLQLSAPGGLLLLSDKAYPDASWMQGLRPETATQHGQSLAHPVNFPLFAALAEQAGASSLCTTASENALHSLLICNATALPDALKQAFEQDFVLQPGNEISHALLEGGHALMQQNQLEAALRSFNRALRYRPQDGTLQYFAAVCYLNQGNYTEALQLLEQPHDDVFEMLNRAILLAESYRLLEQFEVALPYYQQALSYGENAQTFYNLALCLIALGQFSAASEALQQAVALDPEDQEITELLHELLAAEVSI